MDKVYVAVISNQDYHFDDEQKSHLPGFRPVLGVYKNFNAAHEKVFLTFQDENSCEYEELRVDGNTYEYKYTDKEYGGHAVYTVQVCEQSIVEDD